MSCEFSSIKAGDYFSRRIAAGSRLSIVGRRTGTQGYTGYGGAGFRHFKRLRYAPGRASLSGSCRVNELAEHSFTVADRAVDVAASGEWPRSAHYSRSGQQSSQNGVAQGGGWAVSSIAGMGGTARPTW